MGKIIIYVLSLLICIVSYAQNVDVTIVFKGGKSETNQVELVRTSSNSFRLVIPQEKISKDVEIIKIQPEFAKSKIGDDGYMILPNGILTKFINRKDASISASNPPMAFFGAKTSSNKAYVGIVKSMPYTFSVINKKSGNDYFQYIQYDFKRNSAYADIIIDYTFLSGENANYSSMAREYRNYKLEKGDVKTIKEKIKSRPALEYCLYAPEIRIRQGWKPAPPKVLHQTLENEPKMKVAVTFERVGEIIKELKLQGVDKAEICLVGWNVSGHDGRYPQMFPVEESLGGEEKLRSLIKYAQEQGYQITCHTNSTDAYEIADTWNEEFILKNKSNELQKDTPWSGGQMYQICWKRAYEKFGENDLKKVAELGFKGMHYIDVVSCVCPRQCYDSRHSVTPDEASNYMNKIFDYCNKTFGGSMSEGGYDHCFGYVDSALYISFLLGNDNKPMLDRQIPIWQLVYHGIVISNPGPYTVNYVVKDAKTRLKFFEFGGRPTFYFHSKFREGASNWMGEDDITCETDEKMKSDISKIKVAYDDYRKLAHLQLEFMDFHDEIAKDVFITRYSDGSRIISNYTNKPFEYEGNSIEPLQFFYTF